ncbi:hypothetical protein B0F90DRAFT_1722827 [Multifurca ochricompacta]|uniref:Transmembrane protein n=1 Tax=Multifurca ochricompacta TaxID=376703 RepID=A0AAD4M608_9AGAM|nr:hypothetical protein B0F90DRAFT_1722827 [Multifurca ochricompacta]
MSGSPNEPRRRFEIVPLAKRKKKKEPVWWRERASVPLLLLLLLSSLSSYHQSIIVVDNSHDSTPFIVGSECSKVVGRWSDCVLLMYLFFVFRVWPLSGY